MVGNAVRIQKGAGGQCPHGGRHGSGVVGWACVLTRLGTPSMLKPVQPLFTTEGGRSCVQPPGGGGCGALRLWGISTCRSIRQSPLQKLASFTAIE